MSFRPLVIGIGAALLIFVAGQPVFAQDIPPDTARVDTADVVGPESSEEPSPASDETVHFSARDSLVIVTDTSSNDTGTLHGEAEMTFKEASLRSKTIEMDFENGTLRASGSPSDTAQNARPVFQPGEGGESFTGEVLSYNVNTERGRVVTARTQQQEGFVEGGTVKLFEDSTLFVKQGSYTTCECPPGIEPSYSLRSDQMKVHDEWVYTGPIQLFLFNVPTPLWLPFGFLPNSEDRRSGPLSPDYGEDRFGLFLKDMGWYFALNDFTDLTLRGGIWSQGTFEVRPRFRYRKRNQYNGDLQVDIRRERMGEPEDPDFLNRLEGQLRWQHSQTLSPRSSINGNINLVTSSDFSQRNSETLEGAVQQDISSSLSYRKQWPNGGRELNLSGNQQQQFQSGSADDVRLSLPNISFSQNRFKPFSQERAVNEEQWFEKIITSYSFDVNNTYDFRPRNPDQLRAQGDSSLAREIEQADIGWFEALFDRDKYELATGDDDPFDFQAVHDIPINATFRVNRFNMSVSPSINYSSDWRLNTVRVVAEEAGAVPAGSLETTQQTVGDFHARHDLRASLSANAEAFGTFPLNVGPLEGLRHRLLPSVSFNYRPNFNAPFWGRTRVLRDEDGTPVRNPRTGEVRRFDILSGSLVRSSTEQQSVSVQLRNTFESKRVRIDSSGNRNTNRVTLLNLDLQGLSYNLAADSFQVSDDIRVNARTTVDQFDFSLRTTFSPYSLRKRNGEFRRIDRLMIRDNPLTPARLTSLDFRVSGNIGGSSGRSQGRNTRRGVQATEPRRPTGLTDQSPPSQPGSVSQTPDARRSDPSASAPHRGRPGVDIPWSLNFDFNYRFQKPQKDITSRTATFSTDFTLGLTERWQIQGSTGYDFIQNDVSTTRVSMARAVGSCGCWIMSFSWVPFGEFQSYSFNLQVSSGRLADLLRLQFPQESGEGRLGGFGDQLQGTLSDPVGGGQFP